MLTPNDQRNDGKFTRYLSQPNQWKKYDPELFDFLHQTVLVENRREIRVLESTSIIPNAKYHATLLRDSVAERSMYFDEMLKRFAESDLIFFDPDNGLEVRSVPQGRPKSSKYLYYDEVANVFRRGYSLLIYQHFPRTEHYQFIKLTGNNIKQSASEAEIYALATKTVVYFLVSQPKHATQFREAIGQIRNDQIEVLSL